jgi:putative membrane protein
MRGLLAAASLGALLVAAPAWAQGASTQNTTGSQNLSSQDKTFVEKAGAGNLAEAQLGQLAEQKAATPAVKEFGRWMATDHTFANNWLVGLAKEIPEIQQPTLTSKDKTLKQKLEGLNGTQFDQQYLPAMVQDHQQDVAAFEAEAKDGQNQKIKGYAESLLPVLRQHLAEARALSSNNGMAANRGPSATEGSGSSTAPQH